MKAKKVGKIALVVAASAALVSILVNDKKNKCNKVTEEFEDEF